MTKADKPLAKSLHTISVLVRVSNMLMAFGMDRRECSHEDRLEQALFWLGLDEKEDPYGLAAAALAQLKKGDRYHA